MEIADENSPLCQHGKHSFAGHLKHGWRPGSSSARTKCTVIATMIAGLALLITITTTTSRSIPHSWWYNSNKNKEIGTEENHDIAVAFVGNSMFYFNDFPRLFQMVSSQTSSVYQNSCLHGGGSIPSLLLEGNAMYPQFGTPNAIIHDTQTMKYVYDDKKPSLRKKSSSNDDDEGSHRHHQKQQEIEDQGQETNPTIYDYGACTVEQLLTGTDPRLDDPGYAVPEDKNSTNKNPCREDANYLDYTKQYFAHLLLPSTTTEREDDDDNDDGDISALVGGSHRPQQQQQQSSFRWDYIFINDNTRDPARKHTRARSLQFLEQFYVPLFRQTGATPVFLWTHAYSVESTPTRNMAGLDDVANFTSLTGVGYRAYADLLALHLPPSQAPRVAPVGLAFLWVYEDRPDLWPSLFHSDRIHASPSGSLLQACICHYTVFGTLPPREWVVKSDMPSLWASARMMQHAWEPANPIPDRETAEYLYDVARRIMVDRVVPKSFIDYQNGEVADLSSTSSSEDEGRYLK